MIMGATLAPLTTAELPAARAILAVACAYDRAAAVADEKLFGRAPHGEPATFGAWLGGILVGVAVASGDRVRVLAVHPAVRRQGIGGALLAACERTIWARAARRARVLDEPGNYLAPGVDLDNVETLTWLERRGYQRRDEHENLIVDVRTNPKVSPARGAELAARCAERGYQVRRARPDEVEELSAAISIGFGGAWPFEVERACGNSPCGLHVAARAGRIAAFAARDGNNRGLGWFGPAGTWPEHRGQGLGEALLVASLVDIAADHATAEIAWIGPREFYERTVGTIGVRRFAVMTRDSPFKRSTIPPG